MIDYSDVEIIIVIIIVKTDTNVVVGKKRRITSVRGCH